MKDEENLFWIAVWRTVAAVICVVAVSISSCSAYKHSIVRDLVVNGAPPAQAYCAVHMGGSTSDAAFCSVVEMKK